MQQHSSKYFPAYPPPPSSLIQRMGSKVQNSAFSELGHNAYHIKGNAAFCNMVAWKQIFCPQTPLHPTLEVWFKRS